MESSATNQINARSIALVLPVLDEIDGLKYSLPKINKELFTRVLIVDGGSKDGSVEYARSMGFEVYSQKQRGLSRAVIEAAEYLDTEYMVTFSPDGNCLPEDLSELVKRLDGKTDVVVASRYLPPATSDDDSLVTAFGNWMFTKMISGLGPHKVTDSLTIYRGYRRKLILSPLFLKILKEMPVLEPLTTCMAGLFKLNYQEFPSNEPPRIGGETKMSVIYNGSCILWMIIQNYCLKFLPKKFYSHQFLLKD